MPTELQDINWYPVIGYVLGAAGSLILLLGGFVLNRWFGKVDQLGLTVGEIRKDNASEHKAMMESNAKEHAAMMEAIAALGTRMAVAENEIEHLNGDQRRGKNRGG